MMKLQRKAQQMARAFGVRRAAAFLRNRGVSVEGAVAMLLVRGDVRV